VFSPQSHLAATFFLCVPGIPDGKRFVKAGDALYFYFVIKAKTERMLCHGS